MLDDRVFRGAGDWIRKNAEGQWMCARCTALATFGWVYEYGQVRLLTCSKKRCAPDKPWDAAVRIVPTPRRKKAKTD